MEDAKKLDDLVEIPHEFRVELNCLVLANLRLTLEGIARAEDEELTALDRDLKDEDWEISSAVESRVTDFYNELRTAALCFAMVALVTRFQSWISRIAQEARIKTTKDNDSKLISELFALDKSLGEGPAPRPEYFRTLVDVRNSVIHADSNSRWTHGGKEREVNIKYCNGIFDRLELTEELLWEAVEKVCAKIQWYDERLHRNASQRFQ